MRTPIILAGLLLASSPVRADWAPAPCSRCFLEEPDEFCVEHKPLPSDALGCQQDSANPRGAGTICSESTVAAQNACCAAWLAAGWRLDCVDSSWSALWCRPRQSGDPARGRCPGQPEPGCAIGRATAAGGAASTLILMLFAVVGLMRRRRR